MNEGGWAEAATTVRRYHALSKHNPRHYAPGPGGLDWANQPNPFRRFKGSAVVPLPLVSGDGMLAYDHLFRPAEGSGPPLDGPSLGLFFELGLGLSAWKEYGSSRWALRNNPSSGNLHPTEGYLVLPTDVDAELFAGVYHYLPHEHALERRCRFAGEVLATINAAVVPGGTLVGLSSVHCGRPGSMANVRSATASMTPATQSAACAWPRGCSAGGCGCSHRRRTHSSRHCWASTGGRTLRAPSRSIPMD
jgi:hypothetical protein